MDRGWAVGFDRAPALGLPNATVAVPATQLVLGIANGWTTPASNKTLYIPPDELGAAWAELGARTPRGVMFWDIGDEGDVVPRGSGGPPLYLAAELNKFLKTRGES